jgi:predicted component of type VI protein secretion system
MPMFLVPLEGGDPIALDKAITFIGRHPDCDVVLNDSRKVSRKHCCVAQVNEAFVVRDLGSMNGVRVNDDVSHEEMRVRPGDELWVGDVGFRLEFRPAPAKGKPADERTSQGNGTTAGNPLRNAKLDRRFISQDMPVAIPEEGADLIVENTQPRMRKPPPTSKESDVIELGDADIVDDDDTQSGRR